MYCVYAVIVMPESRVVLIDCFYLSFRFSNLLLTFSTTYGSFHTVIFTYKCKEF